MAKKNKLLSQNKPITEVASNSRHPLSGSTNHDFTITLSRQAAQSSWFDEGKILDQTLKATIGVMKGINPQDELEGMLAAQLLATHNATMECFRRAMLPEQAFEGRQASLSQANKLTRSYAMLMETLTRYRNKGASEQKVTVQHVHVHDGGKAIVGNIE